MESTARKLYEIGSELELLVDAIIEDGGVIDDAGEAALNALELELKDKAERVALAHKACLAHAKMIQTEIDRLEALKAPYTRTAESLKLYLETWLQRTNIQRVDGDLVKMWFQKNSQDSITLDPSVEVAELLEDWPELVTTKVEHKLNREVILAAKETETLLPSCITVERGKHLRIK